MDLLPPEIIIHILQYLEFDDRQKMALINKKFYYASLHPQFLKKEILVYNPLIFYQNKYSTENKSFMVFKQIVLRSKRQLIHLKLVSGQVPIDHTIFESIGYKIISLHLEYLDYNLTDTFLNTIIRCCINLESLVLKGTILNCYSIKPNKPLLKLSSIALIAVDMSDKNFNELTACAPNLQDLGFKDCKVLIWPQAIRRYYKNYNNSETTTNFNSDLIFTDANIINYLETTKFLKTLRLKQLCHIFLQLPKHIQLNSLMLDGTEAMHGGIDKPIDLEKLKLILERQTTLQQLDISCFPCCLLSTVAKLHKLKHLKVNFTTNDKSVCVNKQTCLQGFVELLKDMKELRTLILVPWTLIPSDNIESPVLALPDCTLKSITSLNCKIQNGLKVMQLAKNLTRLQIPNGDILTTNDLQLLFKNLISLRYLKIHNCIKLDDDILLHSSISNLKGLVHLEILDTSLTYRCLPRIKLLNLKVLIITNISELNTESIDVYNFEDTIKTFRQNVPVLNHLTLLFKDCIKRDYIYLLRRNFRELSYYKYYEQNKGISLSKTIDLLGHDFEGPWTIF